jgi:predicted O-methyltransferase YrrM
MVERPANCTRAGHDEALNRFYADTVSRSEIPLILDCGANIGLSSIWFARKYPRATVIAVEPESENFRMLTMNTAEYARACHQVNIPRQSRGL